MNSELIAALTELQNIADILGEVYREKAYRRAIAQIARLKFRITAENVDTMGKIAGVGPGILDKIRQFVKEGRIRELEELRRSKKVVAHRTLSKIAGVGPSTIEKWLRAGIDTIPKLRAAIAKGKVQLTHMQKWGLRYYEDLNERIPREEVTELAARVRSVLIQLDPHAEIQVAGSYRRGAATSGDIDILVTSRERFDPELLGEMVGVLHRDGNFIDVLSKGTERVTFLYKSPSGRVRQIDVLNVPAGQFGAALLYFTGSWGFNEAMRGYAKKKGYRLNQNGLFRVLPGGRLQLIPTAREEDIFEILGLRYVAPRDREADAVREK